ncbi:MAG: patatin-like phospholipase family protein [Prolixibacteraceae bacterium]
MLRRIFIICILLLSLSAQSQKVGLVLSGGGAKGLAHIGLIKVLEDHNIPIDYVAGTSMGAIVAGLYAMGMTPDEMLELFNSDEFKMWSTGRMDKDDLYYFKRNDELPDWMKFDITRKNDKVKLVLPFNLIPERQMDFAFMKLTASSTGACNSNFNQLMVPFRCVATDIYHNQAVVLRDGDLGEAIRASMTIPLVYKPIEKDGMLLFDGGIVNNFPVDIMAEEFRPDIIIGHAVTNLGDNYDKDDVISQIETMVTQVTKYDVPDSMGIFLETKLSDVGLLDFPKINYINSRGIETALLSIDSIEMRIKRRVSKEQMAQKRIDFNRKKPELLFNNVQVEGVRDNMQRKYIIQSIKYNEKVIDIEQLRTSYFKLIADDHIKSIQPIAYYNHNTGLFDLHLKIDPRKPLDVAFGGHLTTRSNTFGFIQANLKAFNNRSYILTSNLYFGRFYNSFLLGGRIDSPSKLPFYVSGAFTLNYWDYFSTSTDLIFTDIRPSYVRQTEQNTKLEIGIPYTKTGVIDVGIAQSISNDEYYQTDIFKEGDKLDNTTFKGFASHVHIDKKNYDYKQYPTEGGRKLFSIFYINGEETFNPGTTAPINQQISQRHSYFRMYGLFDQYFITSKYLTIGAFAEASFNNNTLFSNYTSSNLHAANFAPTPNSKSLYNENYRANKYMAFGGKLIYKLTDNMHFRTEAYGFFPIQNFVIGEDNTVIFDSKIFSKAHLMAMGALVTQTQIGPLSVELNYYDKPGQKWFFSLNMGYMLFNKRGF